MCLYIRVSVWLSAGTQTKQACVIWSWLQLNVIAALTESTKPEVKGVQRASHRSLLVYYNKL